MKTLGSTSEGHSYNLRVAKHKRSERQWTYSLAMECTIHVIMGWNRKGR